MIWFLSFNLVLALNYSAREDIIEGVKKISKEIANNSISEQDITPGVFNNYLSNCSFNTFKSIKLKRANKRRKKYFNRKRNIFITAISKKKVRLIYL